MALTAGELKDKGNKAFNNKDFQRALQLYNEAINLDPPNHVIWANRSAAKAELRDYDGALYDAQRAVDLLPAWPKGYVRKAIALVGKNRVFQAIEAYENAFKLKDDETIQRRVKELERNFVKYAPKHRAQPVRSIKIETDLETCHLDVALAFAAGRDIQLPLSPSAPTVRAAIVEHATRNPGWDAPKRRYLFVPCVGESKGNLETTPRNVEFDPARKEIGEPTHKLLGCQFDDSEVLYSEDGAEMMRGNRKGVGLGYIYRTWEFIMDDNCVATRPLNELASRLLHRPETYGPVLILRATHLKSTHDLMQPDDAIRDTIAWEVLPLEELETEEWRVKRAEWKELVRRNRNTEVGKIFGNSIASSRLEGLLKGLQGIQVVHV